VPSASDIDVRVLYLNPFSQEVSGPDESLRTLLAALIPRGLEAHVVLPAAGPQVPRYEALGARVHTAPLAVLRRNVTAGAALYPARLARATAAIVALARRIGADVIHTNMEVLLEGGLAARLLRRPHVLHYRGNTLDEPKWVFDALVATWTATADHVFCISEATADIFRRRRHHRKVEALHNPVDLTLFGPAAASAGVRAALGARPGDCLIGTVGRIHPRKDLETFVRAAARIASEVPQARFVIVGAAEADSELAYRDRLDALVRESGLGERLTFAGARRDIPDVMRALDVFVLTSRHEGFGRVVAEAMATGRPLVVTDEGAPPALVGHGRFGLCAPAGDDAAFARQVAALLADPAETVARARRATEAARDFGATAIADRVWARYRALVDARA
jgi:glycosyltransferase involved in cell wall biosynthesis